MVKHHYRAMVNRETAKAALELIAIDYESKVVRPHRLVSRQEAEIGCPAALLFRLGVAGANEEAIRPGVEARGVAKLRKVLPDAQQRLLRRILGKVEVAQDPARHGQVPIRDPGGKVGKCPLVSVLGLDHEIGIHAPSASVDIGRAVCRPHGMGRRDMPELSIFSSLEAQNAVSPLTMVAMSAWTGSRRGCQPSRRG